MGARRSSSAPLRRGWARILPARRHASAALTYESATQQPARFARGPVQIARVANRQLRLGHAVPSPRGSRAVRTRGGLISAVTWDGRQHCHLAAALRQAVSTALAARLARRSGQQGQTKIHGDYECRCGMACPIFATGAGGVPSTLRRRGSRWRG
eukprot:scaffold4768_cov412-Prasinococcus_capsulatus_cf.AAC.23